MSSPSDELDITLRPRKWDDYVGQRKIKENLKIFIKAAEQRKENFEHLLFYGNSGLGKTTLAYLIARETGKELKIISAPAIEKTGDLAAILTNVNPGSILFIDECHRLAKNIEEYLYPAMEEFKLNLIIGKGPMAKTMEIEIPRFSLIGATTRLASLSSPLRSRFGAIFGLNFYEDFEIEKILERSAKILNINIDRESIKIIAKCSRSTPRTANHLLKRVRDFAQVKGKGEINPRITEQALKSLEIDKKGLTAKDKKILESIIKKFNGGPVGLQALAAASYEEKETILDIYEPYLMQIGFIKRTSRGRVATKAAYGYLGEKYEQGGLL